MTVIPPNPLALLDDEQLVLVHDSLRLVCLRSKSSTRKKHSERFCALWATLGIERERRGLPAHSGPYTA